MSNEQAMMKEKRTYKPFNYSTNQLLVQSTISPFNQVWNKTIKK